MVEMTGIEPVSKNPLTQLSPWAAVILDFPLQHAKRQACRVGSPFLLDRIKGEPPVQVHRCLTLSPEPRYSRGERAAHRPRHR